ncbi:FKBP-type peptidyl-prolyl cis-trans isomerase [Microbacterium sp. 2FI]|uniref:FKBP-type peptidyl-prolyl cis-trans isomerase n=1 Tax=Microbacterium sp. 2FI TaxID=2502193 RepID=UPI0010F725B3|nr:FKBP-type peptidyl-prolyl cis-trans isomerase [Microbacterium sp. 2FI]
MRIRPLAALSVAVLSALVLAGCASGAPESEPTPTDTAATGLCEVAAPTGEVVESITVTGEVGVSASAEFTAPLTIESAERTVVVEGEGDPIEDGDYVSYALAVFDATTGESVQEGGFDGVGLPPMPITLGSGADTFFGCATEGSRIAMTVPDAGSGAQVYVIDVLDVIPADEWCAVTEPGDDFPTVEFSAEGIPTVTIPDADAPTEVQLEVLEEGDGDVVQPGDSVTVNYTGVKWSDGTVFDSSFERGEPATFQTTGVVTGFQRALEGQAVGSTVLVSMPPACGYGEGEINADDLVGETLVFVVEIIETARATE